MRWGAITRLIAGREIAERLRGRATRVMTVATALLVVAGVTIPGLITGTSKPAGIGLVGSEAQALAPELTRAASATRVKVTLTNIATDAAARRQLTRGQLDAALILGAPAARVEVTQSLSPTLRAVLRGTLDAAHLRQALVQARVPVAKVLRALAPVPLRTKALHPPPKDETARAIAAIAAGVLMYISLMLYGTAVANGVAQEKTSRTAEVLLAAVRPGQLLTGKVLGIGLTGLGQLALAAVAGLIANAVVHSARIPASVWALLPAFLVFFLAGFALYAFVCAAAGALVARQEEVQSVMLPITMPLIVGYLLVYLAIASPNATWLKLISFLPPLTATLMPARIALGHVAWWELPVDAVIMLASIYGVARIASRIYTNALIRGGARLSWGAALRKMATR